MKKLIILFLILLFATYPGYYAFGAPPADGHYKELHANGKIKEDGYYKNGQKHRIWLYYDENGQMQKKEKWKAGKMQWQVIYEDGKISTIKDKNGKVKERPKCGC